VSDPIRTPEIPDSHLDELVDALLGEGPEPDAVPGTTEARAGLEALLSAERTRFAAEEQVAAADGPRLARFLVARVREDEAAHRVAQRARTRRSRWGRILAISVGAHALLLGFVAWNLRTEVAPTTRAPTLLGKIDSAREPTGGLLSDAVAKALEELEIQQLDKLPASALVFDEADADDGPVPDAVMELAMLGAAKPAIHEWPRGMALSLARRRSAVLKQSRLRALGYDSEPTLDGVRRGLRYLASRQAEDGSFPSAAGADRRASTALALLPFLGDGHSSLSGEASRESRLVAAGISYLQSEVFAGEQLRADVDTKVLRPVLIALSEDYMLGYARLLVDDAKVRGQQIRALVSRLRADQSLLGTEDAHWAHWSLDAATRTGIIDSLPQEERSYAAWRSAVANGPTWSQSIDAEALARGSALIGLERGATKTRFQEWQPDSTRALLEELQPNGKAKGRVPGDRVERTARILLALQLGYRAY
jgi:hypothetical protein